MKNLMPDGLDDRQGIPPPPMSQRTNVSDLSHRGTVRAAQTGTNVPPIRIPRGHHAEAVDAHGAEQHRAEQMLAHIVSVTNGAATGTVNGQQSNGGKTPPQRPTPREGTSGPRGGR